jgi:NCAIR mutase (PurE)-related protein
MPDDETADFVELDLDRAERRGYPEAVLCAGKTPEQVGVIAAQLRRHRALFTRASAEHAAACSRSCRTPATSRTAGCWPGRRS